MIPRRGEYRVTTLLDLRPSFLQADDISLLTWQPVEKSFAGRSANPVNIERYDSHTDLTRTDSCMSQQTITAREREFLKFAIDSGVLRFGEFTLKSGRVSPYSFNAGLLNTGALLGRAARFYATTVDGVEPEDLMLFRPAYKEIPLAAATAAALAEHHDRHAIGRAHV